MLWREPSPGTPCPCRGSLTTLGSISRVDSGLNCRFRDCDGRRKAFIHDLDGSLTGMGPDASIMARSEVLNEFVNSQNPKATPPYMYSMYFIPSKMLYDPCPAGNDPTDPTCDMSPWEKYSGGAQSFNYRRRSLNQWPETSANASVGAAFRQDLDYAHHAQVLHGLRRRQQPGDETELPAPGERHRRQLLSAKIGDWRDRMVFFPGDEREAFYAGQTGRCAASLSCGGESSFFPFFPCFPVFPC